MDFKKKMELENLVFKMEELTSLIFMYEQAVYCGDIDVSEYEMGMSHIVCFSKELSNQMKKFMEMI